MSTPKKNRASQLHITIPFQIKSITLHEYLEKRKVDIPILKEEPKKDKNKVINNSVDNTNKLNKIMKEIELLDNDLKKFNNKLLEKEVYMNVAKAKEIEQEILNITNKIEEKTNEWESLANKVE